MLAGILLSPNNLLTWRPHFFSSLAHLRSIRAHFAIAFLILIFASALFTSFRGLFPHPEPFSPVAYAAALFVALFGLLRLRPLRSYWLYLLIPITSLFGLLEEISYGVEINLTQPLYWPFFDEEVYDVHNVLPMLLRFTRQTLHARTWDVELFSQFLRADLLIVLALFLFVLALRTRRNIASAPEFKRTLLSRTVILTFLITFLPLISILRLPTDPKNAWLLGYSPLRFAAIAFFSLAGLAALGLALALRDPSRARAWIAKSSELQVNSRFVSGGRRTLKLLLLASIAFQLLAPLNLHPVKVVQIARLSPIFMWLLAEASLILLASAAWRRAYPHPSVPFPKPIRLRNFLTTNPTFIHLSFAVFIVLLAQVIDRGRISLHGLVNPSFLGVRDWNLWVEEILEAVGGLELLLAASLMPKRKQVPLVTELGRKN